MRRRGGDSFNRRLRDFAEPLPANAPPPEHPREAPARAVSVARLLVPALLACATAGLAMVSRLLTEGDPATRGALCPAPL